MTSIRWRKAKDGDFADPNHWRGDTVPEGRDIAVLGPGNGADYTVRSSVNEMVGGLKIAANATLAVSGPNFFDNADRGRSVNAGLITVSGDGDFLFTNTLRNTGAVTVSGAEAVIATSASTTLVGGGAIRLDGGRWILASSDGTVANKDETISGNGGILGGPETIFANDEKGVVEAFDGALQIGGPTVENSGLIEAVGVGADLEITGSVANSGTIASLTGSVELDGAVVNQGLLIAQKGAFTVDGGVSGSGSVEIKRRGRFEATAAFSQDVAFRGNGATLVLNQSVGYGGALAGFSTSGGDLLVLNDIAFVGSDEASFSGDASGGVLTVSDGAHTATIHLLGDYLSTQFVTSAHGAGVKLTAQAAGDARPPAVAPSVPRFAAHAAALAPAHFGGAAVTHGEPTDHRFSLWLPRPCAA